MFLLFFVLFFWCYLFMEIVNDHKFKKKNLNECIKSNRLNKFVFMIQ